MGNGWKGRACRAVMRVARRVGGSGDSIGRVREVGVVREGGGKRTAPVHCVGYGGAFCIFDGFIFF